MTSTEKVKLVKEQTCIRIAVAKAIEVTEWDKEYPHGWNEVGFLIELWLDSPNGKAYLKNKYELMTSNEFIDKYFPGMRKEIDNGGTGS